MKKYRSLVPIVMIVLMLASWYVLINDSIKLQSQYNGYLSEARRFAEMGATKPAIENYNLALDIKGDADIYIEVAEYYKTHEGIRDYLAWCENFFERCPTEPKAYDCILNAYASQKDYRYCYDILETAEKRKISTDYIKKLSNELMYAFELDYNTYEDISVYSNGLAAVKEDDLWGFVDQFGELKIGCKYTYVGSYTQSEYTPVKNQDGEIFFIDKSGSRVLASKEKYKSFGLFSNEMIATQKENDKYTYLDKNMKVMFGDYDFASTMNANIAVVKSGEKWQIIDEKGKAKTDAEYIDVKLDEKNIAYRNDRLFVSTSSGKYIMIDKDGKQIGSLKFDDAKVFSGDGPTAVKIGGKWCFVNKDGKLISDKKYDDARSFSNGLAAVCISGKWGFVNVDEKVVIEPQFFGAMDFNEKGGCFVRIGNEWQLLKLYRLNRED